MLFNGCFPRQCRPLSPHAICGFQAMTLLVYRYTCSLKPRYVTFYCSALFFIFLFIFLPHGYLWMYSSVSLSAVRSSVGSVSLSNCGSSRIKVCACTFHHHKAPTNVLICTTVLYTRRTIMNLSLITKWLLISFSISTALRNRNIALFRWES